MQTRLGAVHHPARRRNLAQLIHGGERVKHYDDGMTQSVTGAGRLEQLQALTDATLSRLDVADLLDELLERVRDVLDADTAAILLLDPHAQELAVTAAKGLEEEVRRGVRIAVGDGFAGRIAQTRQPLVLLEVTPQVVASPVLVARGVRSMLGVPILAAGELIGVLHVGTLRHREFTADDTSLLQLAADRAGVAGQIRTRKVEQAAALALQRSLLPATLPALAGLSLAARYVPGHELGVGGDWYDVFSLPSGWLGMVIGDVSGHGLASAVVMGRVRSALRAYALITDDPAEVLTMLDRKVRHFEAGSLTTALYAMIAPDRRTVRLCSAGHLPPVLAVPGRPVTLVDIPLNAPLGVGYRDSSRRTAGIDLPPGALLLGYTDGLVERRTEIIDIGIEALLEVVKAAPPDIVCTEVMARLAPACPVDDIAVLALRRDTGT